MKPSGVIHDATRRVASCFKITGAFAEFERSMIRQRINAGLKRAVEQGRQLGRPRISADLEKRIQGLLRTKKGMLAIAKECGVGTGTVQRIAREVAPIALSTTQAPPHEPCLGWRKLLEAK